MPTDTRLDVSKEEVTADEGFDPTYTAELDQQVAYFRDGALRAGILYRMMQEYGLPKSVAAKITRDWTYNFLVGEEGDYILLDMEEDEDDEDG